MDVSCAGFKLWMRYNRSEALMRIQKLPDEVASQIAAGEVVERPVSVVKELVENALDAGARQINIRVEQAGRRLIEVNDDGNGIPLDELELAVTRHATSKLRLADDLFHIHTLGFRGEALASIASVSQVILSSKTREQPSGGRVVIEGGKFIRQEQLGMPAGTTVCVENLFYNVPARLKFLKRDATERQLIENFINRYAVAYPSIRFSLTIDGKQTMQTNGLGQKREVLVQLYGVDIARQMLELNFTDDDLRINGFISPISLTRSNRRELTFFINGRWVQDGALTSALLKAYHSLLMVGRYPLAILFIDISAEDVDVNVHPAKSEVRFRNPDRLFTSVQRAVRRALVAHSPVAPVQAWGYGSLSPGSLSAGRVPDPAWQMKDDLSFSSTSEDPQNAVEPQVSTQYSERQLPSGQIPLLRLIGQVGGVYLVAEGPDGLYLIDQHAAHERVLFEKLMQNRYRADQQTLLTPLIIHLSPVQSIILTNQTEVMERLGFHIEYFGSNTFRVHAIPAMFSEGDPLEAVRSIVEDFEEDETTLQNEIEAKIAARVCKRMAVKAGQILSIEEQKALVHELEVCQNPRTCPHGRPTMIHLSVDLLERQFGRRGSR